MPDLHEAIAHFPPTDGAQSNDCGGQHDSLHPVLDVVNKPGVQSTSVILKNTCSLLEMRALQSMSEHF